MSTCISASVLFLVQAVSGVPAAPEVPEIVGPSYRFADFDGDSLVDVYVVRPAGGDRLFRNLGDGTFVDVTAERGLAGASGTRLALWQDFDGDARLDLYLCAARGASRLLRQNEQGVFADVTALAGLARGRESELYAEWLDYDGDGWPDLHVVTSGGDRIHHNLGNGRFEPVALPELGELDGAVVALSLPQVLAAGVPPTAQGPAALAGGAMPPGPANALLPVGTYCPVQLKDAITGNCVPMSSVPAIGQLYPLSVDFNVDPNGNVGLGTTTPSQRLDVAGVAQASRFVSTVATGTQPLQVSSSTKVLNLNADQIDGLDASVFSQLGASIEGAEITDGTVDAADLAGSSVTTGKLASNSVTSGKIVDGTIASADIATSAVNSTHIAVGSVGSMQIAGGAVGTAHLAADAVDSTRVLDGAISLADLASNSVDGARIVDGSVDTVDIAGSSVTSGKIANGTIATADIASGAITNALLAANAVGTSNLQLASVGLPHLNTTGAVAGQYLGFNGSGAQWLSAPTSTWTPISSLPYTITQSGAYYVAGNLVAPGGSDGITVSADSVLLDLNGFELSPGGSGIYGIHVSLGASGCVVRNGILRGWSVGLYQEGPEPLVAESVIAEECSSVGFYVNFARSVLRNCHSRFCFRGFDAYGVQLENCTAHGNSNDGFFLSEATLLECRATSNGDEGFVCLENCSLDACQATGSGSFDIRCNAAGTGDASIVTRCRAGTYLIGAGNVVGPIVTTANVATNTNPHANYQF